MNNNVIYLEPITQSKNTLIGHRNIQKEDNIITVDFPLEAKLKRDEDQLVMLRNAFDEARATWVLEPAELLETNRCIVK